MPRPKKKTSPSETSRKNVLKNIENKVSSIQKVVAKIKTDFQESLPNTSLNPPSPSTPTDPPLPQTTSELPPPHEFQEIASVIVISLPMAAMPMRIPDFLNNLSTNTLPTYFLYSLLAAGYRIKRSSPDSQIVQQEAAYAETASKLLKQATTRSDPYYIWSCILLSVYYSGICKPFTSFEHVGNAINVAKLLKYHQLDLPTNKNLFRNLSGEQKEFRRRIWWSCYVSASSILSVSAIPKLIDNKDCFVNLPSNDFYWKYGGPIQNCSKQLKSLNVASLKVNNAIPLQKSFYFFSLKAHILSTTVSDFLTTRWNKKNKSDSETSNKIHSFITQLEQIKTQVNDVFQPSSTQAFSYSDTEALIINDHLKTLHSTQLLYTKALLNFIKVSLLQSELVFVDSRNVSPESIRSVKSELIQTALAQAGLFQWASDTIPIMLWESETATWIFTSAMALLNARLLKDHHLIDSINSSYTILVQSLRSTQKYYDFSHLYMQYLVYIITAIKNKNDSDLNLSSNPNSKFAISTQDFQPWIVPIYSSFQKFTCCNDSNFFGIKNSTNK
ncbi:hypothetical protein BB558_000133 [Smittium angustum]|uniref:Xylanolytic transcriptional activator regulatory domain-containing protein n=1 Tax=Smittium angustum TaxID=133377 RepID=A0A2U1JF27_SMIAN|nr:hypothetical protein BB558_003256 [Smittium angustum]PWA03706.1 hypothetical protein BB558_000133 [Smittium angustum]